MDIKKIIIQEWVLVGLLAVATLLLILPREITQQLKLNTDYVMIGLGIAILVAFLLYLKVAVVVMFVLLAFGANLPGQIAERFGITPVPLIVALVILAIVSLGNHFMKLLPSGLEAKPKVKSAEGAQTLFYAIDKANLLYANKILSMNIHPDSPGPGGETPLMRAAAKGNVRIVDLLLRNGADFNLMNDAGDTALEIALRAGHTGIADILKKVRQDAMARAQAEAKPA